MTSKQSWRGSAPTLCWRYMAVFPRRSSCVYSIPLRRNAVLIGSLVMALFLLSNPRPTLFRCAGFLHACFLFSPCSGGKHPLRGNPSHCTLSCLPPILHDLAFLFSPVLYFSDGAEVTVEVSSDIIHVLSSTRDCPASAPHRARAHRKRLCPVKVIKNLHRPIRA